MACHRLSECALCYAKSGRASFIQTVPFGRRLILGEATMDAAPGMSNRKACRTAARIKGISIVASPCPMH